MDVTAKIEFWKPDLDDINWSYKNTADINDSIKVRMFQSEEVMSLNSEDEDESRGIFLNGYISFNMVRAAGLDSRQEFTRELNKFLDKIGVLD